MMSRRSDTDPTTIAIDGPGGVGKTTAARRLAKALQIPYLSTGLMYRAVGLAAQERSVDTSDEGAVGDLLGGLRLELLLADRVVAVSLENQILGDELKTAEAAAKASKVAQLPAVRAFLVRRQREFALRWGGVIEGRDIGTRVLPNAPFKFFLDANLEVRTQRRADELRARGEEVDFDALREKIAARDHADRTRAESPLTYDDSYVYIDTSHLSVDEVVGRMLREVAGHAPGD